MKTHFTLKESTEIIKCGKQFIPAMTKVFNKRSTPIMTPSIKGGPAVAQYLEFNQVVALGALFHARKFGFPRSQYDFIYEGVMNKIKMLRSNSSYVSIIIDIERLRNTLEKRASKLDE
jgi:hypothetical protein